MIQLERISGLSSAQAKEMLLKQTEDEARHEMAKLVREIEEEARREADRRARNILSLTHPAHGGEPRRPRRTVSRGQPAHRTT